MGFLRRLLPPVVAVVIVGLFVSLAIYSTESARQEGLAKQAIASTPIRPTSGPDARPATAPMPASVPRDIETVRKGCMEEMQATAVVALGMDSDCDRYAKLLDRQFANVRPSPTYNNYQATSVQGSPASTSPQRSNLAVTANEPMTDAELKRICGKRFDDFNGQNLEELKRRYRIREQSLVPADSEEMNELRCRIRYASEMSALGGTSPN
jgi:hypothetical protein